jgi:hypothetical protein
MVKKNKNVKKKKINKKTKILKKHSKKSKKNFNDVMANAVISNALDNLFV